MSQASRKREFLEAARMLTLLVEPKVEDITNVLTTLSAVLTDITGEKVIVMPLTKEDFENGS